MKKVLTIGAYERDNFGDLLFYIITREYLKEVILVPGSLKFADVPEMGETVLPYKTLLDNFKWDAVLVVGGEVGSLDIDSALNISLQGQTRGVFWHGDGNTKRAIREFLDTPKENGIAYIPDLRDYKMNQESKLILNSVGLLKPSNQGINKKLEETLGSASKVVVRDRRSYQRLNNLGDKISLAPDIVHTIKNKLSNLKIHRDREYITFQISEDLLDKYSIRTVTDAVYKLRENSGMPVLLIAAGTALLHDSYEKYEQIAKSVNKKSSKEHVKISYTRNPLEIVEQIASSSLWVGSSLHGRIIAIAYSIPRVSLSVEKVSKYSEYWDGKYPFGVDIHDKNSLIDPARRALKTMSQNEREMIAEDLSKKADISMREIVGEII